MPLETATYINDLVTSNPAASDGLNQADDHMRLIKSVLKNTFPGASAPLTATSGPGGSLGATLGVSFAFSQEPAIGFYHFGTGTIGYTGTLLGAVPIGGLMDFAGTTAPAGYLPCDGQAVSRITYAALWSAIGTTWGAGDGSTTFNLPLLQARFRRHRDSGLLAGPVGNLQSPVNLTHTHGVAGNTGTEGASHSHSFSGTTSSMNRNQTHTHQSDGWDGGSLSGGGGVGGAFVPLDRTTSAANTDHEHTFSGTTGTESAAHAHFFSVTSAASGDANESRPYSATVLTCIRVQ